MPNQIVGQNQELLELWMFVPDDILMHIFQFLPAASLLKVAQVERCSCSVLYILLSCVHDICIISECRQMYLKAVS